MQSVPSLIVDIHLDLAMNAIEWNRDLTRPLTEIREREAHLSDRPDRGRGTVSLTEMRKGGVGLCVATQIARLEHDAYSPVFGWRSAEQAWAMTQAQRAWYEVMTERGEMVPIGDRAALDAHLAAGGAEAGGAGEARPIGFILSLEGADSLIDIGYLERAYRYGLRAIGPAHYGPGVYARGTSTAGPFPARGVELLREAERLGMILDLTHLSDESFWQALDLYRGPVWASHHNSRALVPHQRQLSDEMFQAVAQRDAVVGVALDGWMLVPGWQRGVSSPEAAGLRLDRLVDHIDHYCQLDGSARHVAVGSDLDGAYGTEQTAVDLRSIADLQRLGPLLSGRGYSADDVQDIMHGNAIRCLRQALP